jgi:hypothetical protein
MSVYTSRTENGVVEIVITDRMYFELLVNKGVLPYIETLLCGFVSSLCFTSFLCYERFGQK